MEQLYRYVGLTRQGFSYIKARYLKKEALLEELGKLVKWYRSTQDARAGSRSLFYNLDIKFRFGIGVNKFEKLLSEAGLNLRPLRIKVVTTRSSLQSWNYPNLLSGKVIDGINQAIVGDLTYLYHLGKRYYLFCLQDLYSARIVGYHVSTRMGAAEASQALLMCKGLRGKDALEGAIHHTDGGSQYFSKLYMGICQDLKVIMSCAGTCLENGYAEQLNGLIKHHLLPVDHKKMEIERIIDSVIYIYNHQRKQERLGWMHPEGYELKTGSSLVKHKLKLYKFEK
jgi:transposase InsO family protein